MRTLILPLVLLIFASCQTLAPSISSTNYSLKENIFSEWVDFRKGTWILYDVDASKFIKEKAKEDFKKIVKGKFIIAQNDDFLIESGIPTPSKQQLADMKKSSNADFIIYVSSKKQQEINHSYNAPSQDIYAEKYYNTKHRYKKEVRTTINIYDLNQEKLVYSKTSTAVIDNLDSKLIDIHQSTNKMKLKTFKKVFKDLKKNSYH